MTGSDHERLLSSSGRSWRRAAIGALGVVMGGVFLWIALRHIDPGDLEHALREMQGKWLIAGVAVYLAAIGLAATAVQIFCFGPVTILGGLVLLSSAV